MTKKSSQTAPPACQIYLVVDTGASAAERLAAILASTPIASVLIRPASAGAAPQVKALVEQCQAREIAALIDADVALARTVRADGLHLPWSTRQLGLLAEAREVLGARVMIGAEVPSDAEEARHLAMELAESGVDYVAFTAGPQQADLCSWWAEIFEVPCVALQAAGSVDEARQLAATGAEFLAVAVPAGASVAAAAEHVARIAAIIAEQSA